MTFRFSVTEGKTHSTSHTIGFSYGINSTFDDGFSGFGVASYADALWARHATGRRLDLAKAYIVVEPRSTQGDLVYRQYCLLLAP